MCKHFVKELAKSDNRRNSSSLRISFGQEMYKNGNAINTANIRRKYSLKSNAIATAHLDVLDTFAKDLSNEHKRERDPDTT